MSKYPKIFINDFLELIYYFKNINSLSLESTNFSLNDEEFSKIKKISNNLDNETLILFWQFTLKTLEELDIVSNQNLSIEMFLVRLMHLKSFKLGDDTPITNKKIQSLEKKNESENIEKMIKTDTINQIKSVTQEKKVKLEIEKEIKAEKKILINSFDQLIKMCDEKKEIKLKYELEKNVNLVRFENNRIEISFNDDLDKNFVKDLSLKLFEWTGQRWIIAFSKKMGELSIKEKKENKKIDMINNAKQTVLYKSIIEKFPDANLIDINSLKDKD